MLSLLWAVLHHSGPYGSLARRSFQTPTDGDRTDEFCQTAKSWRQRDILPLPAPCLDEVCRAMCAPRSALMEDDLFLLTSTVALWLMVVALNSEFSNQQLDSICVCEKPPSVAQQEALTRMAESAFRFCHEPGRTVAKRDWEAELRAGGGKSCGRYGSLDDNCMALPVVFGELEPGLPKAGIAASVPAVRIAEGAVLEWLQNADRAVLPKDEWPEVFPSALVQGTYQEYAKLMRHLWSIGMARPISEKDMFFVNGKPLVNGMFAVEKKGKPAAGFARVTRLILNMKPGNCVLRMLAAVLGTLAAAATWTGIVLEDGYVLLWSSDDQSGAFHVYILPEAWWKFFVVNKKVKWTDLGVNRPGETWMCICTIPMGWNSAVALFQYLHRRMGFAQLPVGASHPYVWEWRRDGPSPQHPFSRQKQWLQFYLDDFDTPRQVKACELKSEVGRVSQLQQSQREAYARNGVAWAEHKAVESKLVVQRMGAEVDGDVGSVGVEVPILISVMSLLLWLLCSLWRPLRWMQVAAGRLVRVVEFRRPLFGTLNRFWRGFSPDSTSFYWCNESETEILIALSLLPLSWTSLRTPYDPVVVATDASSKGGGTCESSGLSEEGRAEISKLRAEGEAHAQGLVGHEVKDQDEAALSGRTAHARASHFLPIYVLIIGLFDGMGALRACASRMGLRVIGYISCEVDPDCKRLLKLRWPGLVEWGDITRLTKGTIEATLAPFLGLAGLIWTGAGSPCQDLSSLNCLGLGVRGRRSRLIYEVPRVLLAIKEVIATPLMWFVENVASMARAAVEQFSQLLGVRPYLACPSDFGQVRRPRLYWLSWRLESSDRWKLEEREFFTKATFVGGPLLSPTAWVERGWRRVEECLMHTLTVPRRKRVAPPRPCGLSCLDAHERSLFALDEFRVTAYMYQRKFLLQSLSNPSLLRRVSSREAEELMWFDDGTTDVFPKDLSLQAQEDLRLGWLGNTFHLGVVCELSQSPLVAVGALESELARSVLAQRGRLRAIGGVQPFAPRHSPPSADEAALVQALARRAERGHTDVRLDLGVPFRPRAWPRGALRAGLWNWRVATAWRWADAEHINVLEARATLNAARRRLRQRDRQGKRYLILTDSQVCAAVFAKGRTSSRRLLPVLKKFNALNLAGGGHPLIGYVPSSENPADVPSRWRRVQLCRRPWPRERRGVHGKGL